MKSSITQFTLTLFATAAICEAKSDDHLIFEGTKGPGLGKHIVLISGDEEYRSEQAMPMLGELLAEKHGFTCTVLFSLNDQGHVSPKEQGSISHSESLDSADLIMMSIRFRNWDDESMERFHNAYLRGTPMVALRTTNHGFKFPADSKWAKYSYDAKADTGWEGGFGMHLFGMTWIGHHGKHKKEGCLSEVEKTNKDHEILNGVDTIFVESDVYTARPPETVDVLLRGIVTESLKPNSKPVKGKKNEPTQPIAWTVLHKNDDGKTNKIFNTTMGAASDLDDENLRRLVINGAYWALDLPVPKKADAKTPSKYEPSFYGHLRSSINREPKDFIPGKSSRNK